MVEIVLIVALVIAVLLIPASFVLGVVLGRENIRLGLQWQIEVKKNEKPARPAKPLTAKQVREAEKAAEAQRNVMLEWVEGEQPKKKGDAR